MLTVVEVWVAFPAMVHSTSAPGPGAYQRMSSSWSPLKSPTIGV
ncbi:MAG: hypothetical protein U0P45_00900 [Acidimicrobiales bacterium]